MNDNTNTTIRRSGSSRRETPEQRAKKKKQQITAGIVLIALLFLIGIYAQGHNPKGAFIWIIGLGFGYTLQRSRFCFTASLRDPVLTGSTSLTKAVLIALTLASIGYASLQIASAGMGLESLDLAKLPGHVRPVGLHTVIGGFIFGIGAVIAGGCASGTLMRMGEGFVQQWLAFVFFVIGSLIGVVIMEPITKSFIYNPTSVYLPKLLGGWVPAIIVQFALLGFLYVLADWYGKKKAGEL